MHTMERFSRDLDGRIRGCWSCFPILTLRPWWCPKVLGATELLSPIDSTTNRDGDVINFRVYDNVFVDGVLVIPKGATGTGVIKQ